MSDVVTFHCSHVKYTPISTSCIYSHKCNYFYPWEPKGYWTGRGQVWDRSELGSSFESVLVTVDKKSTHCPHSCYCLTLTRNNSPHSWLLWTADMIMKIKAVLSFCFEEVPNWHFWIKSIKTKKSYSSSTGSNHRAKSSPVGAEVHDEIAIWEEEKADTWHQFQEIEDISLPYNTHGCCNSSGSCW